MNKVFSPFRINSTYSLKNRLVVAPMTTTQSNPDGSMTEADAAWLERLAKDGYGMVISCAATISPTAVAFPNQLSVGEDRFQNELAQLAQRVNRHDAVTVIQLCHGGSRATPELTGADAAYSASSYELAIPGFVKPRELSTQQIKQIIADFACACKRVAAAGFAGVELHGANGYLFTQFISKMTNLRQDEYGGGLENRARFAREVVRACRAAVPAGFILGFRILFEGSPFETGLDLDENIQISNWLKEDGIDYIHLSHMDYAATSGKYPDKILLQYLRQNLNPELPLIGVGSIFSVHDAKKALEYGADLVAIGRAAIGNAELPKFFAQGEELPYKTPYSENTLLSAGVGTGFLNYLKTAVPLASLNILQK